MEATEITLHKKGQKKEADIIGDTMREQLIRHAKDFKTSWVSLGQTMYSVWRDKLYKYWGFENFETYSEKELGLKKQLSLKLLKTYFFLEQENSEYLQKEYSEAKDAAIVPNYDTLNVLRMARRNKGLSETDYIKMKKDIFEKGKDASLLKKDLTELIRERKEIDPEEDRENRNQMAIKKLIHAISTFQKDMEVLKLASDEVVQEAEELQKRLEAELN